MDVLFIKSDEILKQTDSGFRICLFIDGGNISLQYTAGYVKAVRNLLSAVLGGYEFFKDLRFSWSKAVMFSVCLYYFLPGKRCGFVVGSLLC